MIRATFGAFLLLAAAFLGGCAVSDADRTRAEGAGAGAAIGAVLGQVLGRNTQSTLIGAAAGTLAGGLVGDTVARRKAEYAKREDELRAEADRANKTAATARTYNEQLARDIAALDQQRRSLLDQQLSEDARHQLALQTQARTEALLKQVNQQIASLGGEITRQRALIDAENQRAAAAPKDAPRHDSSILLVSAGVHDMQTQSDALQRAKAQLDLIDTRRSY